MMIIYSAAQNTMTGTITDAVNDGGLRFAGRELLPIPPSRKDMEKLKCTFRLLKIVGRLKKQCAAYLEYFSGNALQRCKKTLLLGLDLLQQAVSAGLLATV